jgi:hypothetical protein
MDDIPRVITDRETYFRHFGDLHKTCMKIAIEEAIEMSKAYDIPLELFDISALTFQHYKMWNDKQDAIKFWKEEKQKELDDRLAKQIAKGVK